MRTESATFWESDIRFYQSLASRGFHQNARLVFSCQKPPSLFLPARAAAFFKHSQSAGEAQICPAAKVTGPVVKRGTHLGSCYHPSESLAVFFKALGAFRVLSDRSEKTTGEAACSLLCINVQCVWWREGGRRWGVPSLI